MNDDVVKKHAAAKEKVAFWSIVASFCVTVSKGIVGLLTGSLALLSDAAHSLSDVVATSITWLAIRASNQPADETHHYGHGKVESLAALFETTFLFCVAGFICYEGIQRLLGKDSAVEFSWAAIAVLIAAVILDSWRWWVLKKTAREVGGSEALEADAVHFAADLVNSVFVLIAFGLIAYGYVWADALAALATAAFMFYAAFNLARKTVSTLIDTAPKGIAERLTQAAQSVPGIVKVTRARVRAVGGRIFADIHVQVSRTLPLEKVADIRRNVVSVIAGELPQADVEIITEPVSLSTESIMERVMLIAAKERMFVHHITVQDLIGRICIGLDLEVDGRLPIGEAHKIASKLENAIFEELGSNTEVDTHIEPLRVGNLLGADERDAVVRSLTIGLKEKAQEIGGISDIHSIRIRRAQEGIVIHYHCRFDDSLTVSYVHALVDELEWRFRLDHPDVIRVVGHAEPLKKIEE